MSLTTCSKPAPTASSGGAEVVEHLPGLGADVVGADERARRVQGDLPGDDRLPGRHLDHVAVAEGRMHRLVVLMNLALASGRADDASVNSAILSAALSS